MSSWELPGDVHGGVQQVEVLARERAQLAKAEPGKGRGEDEREVTGLDRVGKRVDLLDPCDRPLPGVLDAGAADSARVLLEHAVVDRGREDAAQQSVALRCGRRSWARAAQ